jgi:hypothetical protein
MALAETRDVAAIEGADAASFTVPGPGEPYAQHGVTDRYRAYARAQACDPDESIETWRPFFEARPDLRDWWWHRLAEKTPGS